MKSLNHNQDIQILRGISVISVVLYHLGLQFDNINFFQGGFLGVDIFFFHFWIFDNWNTAKKY